MSEFKIGDMIVLLNYYLFLHGNVDVYLTPYEDGEELKHKVEIMFMDINKNDEYVVEIA